MNLKCFIIFQASHTNINCTQQTFQNKYTYIEMSWIADGIYDIKKIDLVRNENMKINCVLNLHFCI